MKYRELGSVFGLDNCRLRNGQESTNININIDAALIDWLIASFWAQHDQCLEKPWDFMGESGRPDIRWNNSQ